MPIQQVDLFIPPEINAKLLTGEYMRNGGVVRNPSGEIVKLLTDVPIQEQDATQLALHIPDVLRNPKSIGIGIAVGALIAGIGCLVWKHHSAKTEREDLAEEGGSEAFESFSSALNNYLIEAQGDSLSVEAIDRLINAVDTLNKTQEDEAFVIEIPADKLTTLISILYEYTAKLATANAVSFALPEPDKAEGLDAIADLLSFQRDMFDQAA